MSWDFQIIQIELSEDELRKLPNRERNQLVGCMHAHNEVAILNRVRPRRVALLGAEARG